MKGFAVVSAFVDKRTGRTIRPGDPLPSGMDAGSIERLVRARCLAPGRPAAGKPARTKPTRGAEKADP